MVTIASFKDRILGRFTTHVPSGVSSFRSNASMRRRAAKRVQF